MDWAQRMATACRRNRQIPLGVQLEWGVRSAMLRGDLQPGEQLPTLRQLAQDVGANLNTIRAVYARLERDGLIATQQGRGSYVLAQPASVHEGLTTALARSAQAAREAGVSPEQLAAALYVTPDEDPEPDHAAGPGSEASIRRQIREEIAVLERALNVAYAQHPELTVAPLSAVDALGPRVLDAEELRAQRDAILDQLVAVRAALRDLTEPRPEPEPTEAAAARAPSAPALARARIAPA
jgi:GntR family transcriptional regulator